MILMAHCGGPLFFCLFWLEEMEGIWYNRMEHII